MGSTSKKYINSTYNTVNTNKKNEEVQQYIIEHNHEADCAHIHDDDIHYHEKGEHSHYHKHEHKNTKAVINRLSKAAGHLQSVKRMVENGRDCSEVLTQLAAVIAALNNTGKVILEDHINNCIVDAVESGDKKAIEDLNKVIGKFIK